MQTAMYLKHAAQTPFLRGAAALFLCWLLLHIFTISWELPHTMPPEPDGISPKTSLNARGMMAAETFKYPPLQYLIVDALTPDLDEKHMTQEQILENRTLRLKQMRWLTAVMEYLTALLILLFSLKILNLSPFPAFGAALSFLLLPPVLYYSQTTNMDVPYTFWFFASLTSAAFAERAAEHKKIYAALSLLTGFLIACAFCTKDQVYALYLLPAAGFAVWRFRRFRKWSAVLQPPLLWLCTFLPGTFFFYLCIGKDTFLPHLKWITGEGSVPFAIAANTLAGHCRLIPIQLADLGTVLDLPLLLFFALAAVLLFPHRKTLMKDQTCVLLLLATALATLSLHLFLCQVVRYTYLRFLLPLLPFYTMLAACLLQKSGGNRILRCAFALLLVWQSAVAADFLHGMANTPRARLAAELEESRICTNVRINTTSAREGARYVMREDGTLHPKKKIQPWGAQLGLNRFGIYDIMPDDISIYLVSPALLIAESPSPELERLGYRLKQTYAPLPKLLPTLYRQDMNTLFLYAAEAPAPGKDPLASFRKENLETQIIKLAYLIGRKPPLNKAKLAEIGRALAPFREPDTENYELPYFAFMFLHFACRAAGRSDDAAHLRAYIGKTYPNLPQPSGDLPVSR